MNGPKVVSVSPTALPRGGAGTPLPSRASSTTPGPGATPQRRGSSSLAFGDDAGRSRFGTKKPTDSQLRAAAYQSGHKAVGERPKLPELRTPTVVQGLTEAAVRKPVETGGNTAAADDSLPVEKLAQHPWEVPRVDKEKMRDPYLRAQGLHRNDTYLASHSMKRTFQVKDFHEQSAVNFNIRYYGGK